MGWKKLYIESIRALPKKWVHDETSIADFDNDTIVAANPRFPAIMYKKKLKVWKKIKI